MSQREINRNHVIRNVLEGRSIQKDAAKTLCLSERQIRRLCARVRNEGARGIVHRLRGQPSNNQIDPELLEKALCALHEPLWEGFGPKFASEKLGRYHCIKLSKETVRQLMLQTEVWVKGRRGWKHRQWRERRISVGMLVQLDGSDHDWFEGRGPRCVLLIYIDDATSRILYGEFVDVEDTFTLMRSTQSYLNRHGRPVALYVDKDSIYKVNKSGNYESLELDEPVTQFARAMSELGIEVITADSPQAKGRVERGFDTHQDRLVKELRLRGISTKADANRYLWDEYIPEHNARFAVAAADLADAHRPLLATHRLEQILSFRTERTLMNDYTLRHDNTFYQVLERQNIRLRPRHKVEVEERLDGSKHLRFDGTYLGFKTIERPPYQPYLVARPSEQKKYEAPSVKGVGSIAPKDHPWRRFVIRPPGERWQPTSATPAWK